jgi:hypothetical protein
MVFFVLRSSLFPIHVDIAFYSVRFVDILQSHCITSPILSLRLNLRANFERFSSDPASVDAEFRNNHSMYPRSNQGLNTSSCVERHPAKIAVSELFCL